MAAKVGWLSEMFATWDQFIMRPLQRVESAIKPIGRKCVFLSVSGRLLVWLGVYACRTGKDEGQLMKAYFLLQEAFGTFLF